MNEFIPIWDTEQEHFALEIMITDDKDIVLRVGVTSISITIRELQIINKILNEKGLILWKDLPK